MPDIYPSRLNILATANAIDSNIFSIRVGRPLQVLAEQGSINIRCKPIYAVSDIDLLWSDVLIIQRNIDERALRLISLCKKIGRVFVFEIDDLLIAPPTFLAISKEPEQNRRAIRHALKQADIVSTTTERLKNSLGVDTRKVILTPNYSEPINSLPQAQHQQHTPESPCTLILAASDPVLIDFITPSLEDICNEFKNLVSIVVIGPLGPKLSKIIPNIKSTPILPLDDFRNFLSSLPNPIGIIPLDNSNFSNCKSAVKFFEYTLLGIPTICSDVPPYSDVIQAGRTGILTPNTPNDWYRSIKALVTDVDLRKNIVMQARESVLSEHSMALNLASWAKITHEIRSIFEAQNPIHRGMAHCLLIYFLAAKAIFLDSIRIPATKINRARINRRKKQRTK